MLKRERVTESKKGFIAKDGEIYKEGDGVLIFKDESKPHLAIGIIVSIKENFCKKPIVNIRKILRPGQILDPKTSHELDVNYVYWTEKIQKGIEPSSIVGKCFIRCKSSMSVPVDEWSDQGPRRFYYDQCADEITKELSPNLPIEAINYGQGQLEETWPVLDSPLKCMDIFSGCGGLSYGLDLSGATVTKWAIERDKEASNAFIKNHTQSKCFTEDIEKIVERLREGVLGKMPKKGAVDLICGGPPCQGFSSMNMHKTGTEAVKKRDLVMPFLSICNFYKPKFVVMENVEEFSKHDELDKCLGYFINEMGYQCTFGILQARCHGVPQNRRRFFLLAAKPGLTLPQFPEKTHAFTSVFNAQITMNGRKYLTKSSWMTSKIPSAPFRCLNVEDGIGDLPRINGDSSDKSLPWNSSDCPSPRRQYQKRMRRGALELKDHVCRPLGAIDQERVNKVPMGGCARDIPDEKLTRLNDGTFAPLKNKYLTTERGKKKYQRLKWLEEFSTATTKPTPSGFQGKVIHPDQERIISVRESARSQGFPDSFHFCGKVDDKYRQVGNAVPPPLGKAIGLEIRRAYGKSCPQMI